MTAQNKENIFNEEKSFEILRSLITTGLQDMEEGCTLSLEEAFSEIDKDQ